LVKKISKRLESIKAGHQSIKNEFSSRSEDYLEVISELVDLKGYATTLDISRYMNVSAPSVTKMLQRLDENGIKSGLPTRYNQIRNKVSENLDLTADNKYLVLGFKNYDVWKLDLSKLNLN